MKCPKCAAPLQTMPVSGSSILSCPGCYGGFYPIENLTVEIELRGQEPSVLRCPACAGEMKVGSMYGGKIELDQCQGCRGVWLDAGEVQQLRSLAGVEGLIGERARAKPIDAPTEPASDESLANLPDSSSMTNQDADLNRIATLDGRGYRHFQTAMAETTCALGEFPWEVRVGDKALTRDFICPPYMLSNEATEEDSVWSQGRYLEPAEVWAAFKMDGAPPPRRDVAAAQPNPYQDGMAGMWTTFVLAACLAIAAAVASRVVARDEKVFSGEFQYSAHDAEKSRVTPEFELKGRKSNVEIRLNTNFHNQWAYFRIALINSETDQAFDVGREISFYTGRDDEGIWNEGSQSDKVRLPAIPAGRYYLRVEPEDGNSSSYGYTIDLRRDVPQTLPVLLALLALALPFLLAFFRDRAFEAARWQNSDHPWVTSEDDDE